YVVDHSAVTQRHDLRSLIQATSDNPIAMRGIDVMESFVGPDSTGRGVLIEAFIVIRHDLSVAERQIGMIPSVIVPDETARAGGLSRKSSFQLKRFASAQMRQDEMHLAGGA